MLELRIEKVAHGGVFVARPEGKVVLVHGALPGELVLAEVIEDARSFRRALVRDVLEPSEHRQEHFWEAGKSYAGGADFGHIELFQQRELKANVLAEALERMAGMKLEPQVSGVCETGLGYRSRVQLYANKAGRLGVKRLRSDDVVLVEKLPLAVSAIGDSTLLNESFPPGERLELISDPSGKLAVRSSVGIPERLSFRGLDREFEIASDVFWQAHVAAPDVLAGEVWRQFAALEPTGDVLDLYSGAGLVAANIAVRYVGHVTAVELSASAVRDGKRSASDLSNLSYVQSDVLGYLRSQQSIPENLVLDPPRSGAAGKVTAEIIRLRPRNIVYVACDPVALARDLKQFSLAGYELGDISAFDIFPQTHHFETLVSLTLGNL